MTKSYLIAISVSLILVLWMASGLLTNEEKMFKANKKDRASHKTSVQMEVIFAKEIQLSITVQGHVEPNRSLVIRSQTAGTIEEIFVPNGIFVAADTLLVRLNMDDRAIKLEKEKAILKAKQNVYDRISSLAKSDFQSKNQIEEAYSELKIANANIVNTQLDIAHTEIRAPFSGALENRYVEKGSVIAGNGEIATFVDNDPLIVVVPVSQRDIQKIVKGRRAKLTFATGESREGDVRYISPRASQSTRTFRVEIVVDNPDNAIPSGTSVEASIPTEKVFGHFLSPALLSLDDAGQMGVKTVNEKNRVIFNSVKIIRATTDGIWVSGLAEKVNIITIGQGFIRHGTEVEQTTQTTVDIPEER